MRKLLLLLLFPILAHATPCPVTVGALTLNVTQPRTSGISPFLAFFDATTTTSTATLGGAGSVFQDVYFSWQFGDTGTSGSGAWTYGATGQNQKNIATGPIAAHLYVLPISGTTDTAYTAQVWAKVIDASTQAVTIASCTVTVTALAPSGANGFPGANTVCITASATIGSGCPAGAVQVTNQGNFGTAIANNFASGKRLLFKCGDTFTGNATFGSSSSGYTTTSVGAYGGCENTSTNRPILSSSTIVFWEAITPSDFRMADLDFESSGFSNTLTNWFGEQTSNNPVIAGASRFTLYNNTCNGYAFCWQMNEMTESGMVGSTAIGKSALGYDVFWNFGENICRNASSALNCGGTPIYVPIEYNAIIGNNIDGTPVSGTGAEIFRISACRFCVISNNRLANSDPAWGATLKLHSGNTRGSAANWLGRYAEYIEISDNLFTGTSGTVFISVAPQNPTSDERLRFVVIERNFITQPVAGNFSTKFMVSGANVTLRNNVFFLGSGCSGNQCADYNVQVSNQGLEGTTTTSTETLPRLVELYNNTCYSLSTQSGCIGFIAGDGTAAAGGQSFAANNLFYDNGVSNAAVTNNGTGNTVSNNTTNGSLNPNMKNGSGNFSLLGDFLPQANNTGALCAVPNFFDAFQLSRAGNGCRLGALSPAAP